MLLHRQCRTLAGRTADDDSICASRDLHIDQFFQFLVVYFVIIVKRGYNRHSGTLKNRHVKSSHR